MAGYSKTPSSGGLISIWLITRTSPQRANGKAIDPFQGEWRALQGIERVNIIRKGPVKRLPKEDTGGEGNVHHRAARTRYRFNQN